MVTGGVHLHRCIYCLEKALLVDAGEDEAGLVQSFGALSAGPDADGREGMTNAGKERGLLRQGAAVGNHCEGIHLQAVVVVEAKGFVLDDTWVKLEAGGRQALAGAGVAGVQDRHVVFLGHRVDGVEQAQKVFFRVDVLLAVGAQ